MELVARSNIANKVRNTKLPRTKPLWPLFEVISNAIHAIQEAKTAGQITDSGEITVRIVRNGDEKTLSKLQQVDEYPVKSFEVIDNGIGLNDENLNHFREADTDHKINIGGKGVGRFVCLKAFDRLEVSSCFFDNGDKSMRKFEFRNTREGFYGYQEQKENVTEPLGTKIILANQKEEYRAKTPKELLEIGREIVSHFQLFFITSQIPLIILRNQNQDYIELKKMFDSEFATEILDGEFNVLGFDFQLYITKSNKAQSHRLHFCAHNRSVKDEGLATRIIDLGKHSVRNEEGNYYYQIFVTGEALNLHVDLERVGFTFPSDEDEEGEEKHDELTLSKVRNAAISKIEELLDEYLSQIRAAKIEKYRPIIYEEMPQYRSLLHHRSDAVKKLPPNMTKQKLDIELYKIEAEWKMEVKEDGIRLLQEKKDLTNLANYKDRYAKFLAEFNEVGKSDLARYVVHRRSVIGLLEDARNQNDESKFEDEDFVHSIFFPIRSTSDEVPFDKQNLWLIDERLTYHSFLASDKRFAAIENVAVDSDDRTDILIYNNAFAFTDDNKPPYGSFTIVEFKKPQRNDYQDYDTKKNPIEQTESYIESLLTGKVKDRNGRYIIVNQNTPFYVYIICDVTPSLVEILKRREFNPTPDGQGYFLFKSRYYNAYFEVIPFDKLVEDAKKRNRILFQKLGID
jgi:Histidine kinase-, DNA gyrase B-, and HSP90-like ATPase